MTASKIEKLADDVYRNSIYIDKLNLAFCQFFVKSPNGSFLCVATGMRADFAQLKANLESVDIDIASVKSVIAPHFEADEMGALPDFASNSPGLVAYAHPICAHALADIFSVKTKIFKDEVPVTINGEVIVPIFTKHVHQWDSLVVYVPRLKALFSSDVFMSYGPVEGSGNALDGIISSIEKSGYLPSLDYLYSALKKIQKYEIDRIFPMHGPSIDHDIAATVNGLTEYSEANRFKSLAE